MTNGKVELDKNRVKEVLKSLKHANRALLQSNNITEPADDFVYLTVVLKHSLVETSET